MKLKKMRTIVSHIRHLQVMVVIIIGAGIFINLSAKTIVVNNQSTAADDGNPGTETSPLKTIQAGADLAQPGDTILVKEGIYREEVKPPRGGTMDNPIVYYAARGEIVSIRGSERITTWTNQGNDVWMVELDTSFFKGNNPFAQRVVGAWLHRGWGAFRLGDVYFKGEGYRQKQDINDLTEAGTWHTDTAYGFHNDGWHDEVPYPNGKVQISANFGGENPNTNITEINARTTVFFPELVGLRYIVVDGFDMRHAAPQWATIYSVEKGVIGPRFGYGWTIQNCTVAYSRNNGISLGVTDANPFSFGRGDLDNGGGYIPPMDSVGSHIIRNNIIYRNGECGIYGCCGAVGSLIENNVIYETNYRNEWSGTNGAALKILIPIDVVIRNNFIYNNIPKGIWLDWGSQNARVTGNVIYQFNQEALKLEVNFGPLIVDNNIIAGNSMMEEGDGTIVVHNMFYDLNGFSLAASPTRIVPYYEPHSTVVKGRAGPTLKYERWYNNIFVRKGLDGSLRTSSGSTSDGFIVDNNLYLDGANTFTGHDLNSISGSSTHNMQASLDSVNLDFTLTSQAVSGTHPLITSNFIGTVPLAEMNMQYKDGTPLDIDKDFYGNPIETNNVRPGPFQCIGSGDNSLWLWPKEVNVSNTGQGGCLTTEVGENKLLNKMFLKYSQGILEIYRDKTDSEFLKIYNIRGEELINERLGTKKSIKLKIFLHPGIYQTSIINNKGLMFTKNFFVP